MPAVESTRSNGRPGKWVWLFPATYLLHILEELLAGEGFPAWLARVAGSTLTPASFLTMNGIAWVLMVVGVIVASNRRALRWLLATLSTVILVNGLLHLIASIVSASYSPGLITGMLLWAPLGLSVLLYLRQKLSRRSFQAGVIVGLAIHVVVSFLALGSYAL